MASWMPGGRGRPPKRLVHPRTGNDIPNRYRRKHKAHKSKTGDLAKIFQDYLNDNIDHYNVNTEWGEFRRYRAEQLALLMERVWWAKENVATALSEGFGPAVLQPLVEDARINMHNDYILAMGEEPNNKANPWSQGDPSESDAFKKGKAVVNGSEQEIWWHRGAPKELGGTGNAQIYGGNKFQTFAMKRVRMNFYAIDANELDKTFDRPLNDSIPLQVAIPFYQRTAGESNEYNKFLRSFLALPGEQQYGQGGEEYVKILKLNIRGRTERSRDKRTGNTWNLWRALEYGQVAGRYKRVMVKNVTSFKRVAKEEKEDEMRKNTTVAYASSIETDEDWTVFMSPRWQWWARQAVPINGEQLIQVDVSNNYMAGTAPIRRAITSSFSDGRMKSLLGRLLDDAMITAGFSKR